MSLQEQLRKRKEAGQRHIEPAIINSPAIHQQSTPVAQHSTTSSHHSSNGNGSHKGFVRPTASISQPMSNSIDEHSLFLNVPDALNVNWGNAVQYKRSEEGSAGVFIITFSDKGDEGRMTTRNTVVVKGTGPVAEELFTTELARLVGVSTPRMRLVEYTSPEHHNMVKAMARLAGEVERFKVKKELNRPFLLVMEYVEGCDLLRLGRTRAEQLLGPLSPLASAVITSKSAAEFEPSTVERLRALGRVMAFDVAMNNYDRIPVLWNNEGNARNVFLGITNEMSSTNVIAIDNGLISINNQTGVEDFFERVRLFLKDALQPIGSEDTPPPVGKSFNHDVLCSYKRLREFLNITIAGGLELSPEAMKHVHAGVIDGIRRMARLSRHDLAAVKSFVDRFRTVDWANVWHDGMNKIDLDFLDATLYLFRDAIAAADRKGFAEIFPPLPPPTVRPAPKHRVAMVTLFQTRPVGSAIDGAAFLETHFARQKAIGRSLPDLIILPEGWLCEQITQANAAQVLAPLLDVVRRYGVYAVLGTCVEVVDPTVDSGVAGGRKWNRYNTAVFASPKGEILGFSRKQRPEGAECVDPSPNEVPVYETSEFGRVVVLICKDVEDESLMQKVVALQPPPRLLLNPIHIPPPKTMHSHAGYSKQMQLSTWKTATETQARKFERLAREHNFTLLSADIASFGTTKAVGPYHTALVAAPGITTTLDVRVDIDVVHNDFGVVTRQPQTARTWNLENTGNRYLTRIFIEHEAAVTATCLYDMERVVTASADRSVKVFNMHRKDLLAALVGNTAPVTTVEAWRECGKIITGAVDGRVMVFDIRSGCAEHSYEAKDAVWRIRKVCQSSEDHSGIFLCAANSGIVRTLDLRCGSGASSTAVVAEHRIAATSCAVRDIVVLDRHLCVASTSKGTVHVIDHRRPNTMCTIGDHSGAVCALGMIEANSSGSEVAGGKLIISGGWQDGTLRCHTTNGTCLQVLRPQTDTEGATAGITGLWVVPGSSKIVTAGTDGALRIVDTTTEPLLPSDPPVSGRQGVEAPPGYGLVHTLHHHNNATTAISGDGIRLASGDASGVCIVWEFLQHCIPTKLASLLF